MKELKVYIEINGEQICVGRLSGNDSGDVCFSYDPLYLSSPAARPISIGLPLRQNSFDPVSTRIFFDGLLPEGFTRRSVAEWMHADEDDYLTILANLGNECLGAIRIAEDDSDMPEPSYLLLEPGRISALAREGATKSSQMVTEAHLSLTGASGKVGLYYDDADDKWYLPLGSAPSNYIVKQSHVRYEGIVTNEMLCLLTASKLGIEVPDSFILNAGGTSDEDILFATKRYDRIPSDRFKVSGHIKPLRLHQEDFSQALGIPSKSKYERMGDHYLSLMSDLLRSYSSDPMDDILKLWDIVVFNWLIGNTDSHIKNFSLLYSSDLSYVRLAPAYDIISTIVYSGTSRNMGFNIGGEYRINDVKMDNWKAAASDAGIGHKLAMSRFDMMADTFKSALIESSDELASAGFSKANEIAKDILTKGGISLL